MVAGGKPAHLPQGPGSRHCRCLAESGPAAVMSASVVIHSPCVTGRGLTDVKLEVALELCFKPHHAKHRYTNPCFQLKASRLCLPKSKQRIIFVPPTAKAAAPFSQPTLATDSATRLPWSCPRREETASSLQKSPLIQKVTHRSWRLGLRRESSSDLSWRALEM